MNELLTVSDIARICHVHEMTVRRHIGEGKLKSVRVGKGVRVRKEDLEAYLEPKEREPIAAGRSNVRRGRPFTMDDPLWSIVGMIDDPDVAWVSGDKHRALAEAYTPKP